MARMTVPEFRVSIIANGSNDLDSTDPAGAGGAPLAPTGFTAIYLSDTSLSLAWTDNATNEDNYELDRSLTGTGGWTALADPAADATSATSAGLTVDTQYFYRLRAVNTEGNSSYATANGTTTASSLVALEARYHPDKGDTWINWDYPRYAAPAVDIDYKMTGYDWDNRTIVWSLVSPPTTVNSLSINSVSGLITWVPDATEDDTNFSITVRMTAGATTEDKTFTLRVETARATYTDWNTGVDSVGRGSISQPYKTIDFAVTEENINNSGRVYYVRGGTSNEGFVYGGTNGEGHSFRNYTFTEDEPMLIRNYPGETVVNDPTTGGSYPAISNCSIVYGVSCINVDTESIGFPTYGKAVGKLLDCSGVDSSFGNNPSGISATSEGVLDSCVSADNYDRALPSGNSQDYIIYLDKAPLGDCYLIDCISNGPTAAVDNMCAMRTKHAANWDAATYQGADQTFYHRCVNTNTKSTGWTAFALAAGESMRHGISIFTGTGVRSDPIQAELNRPGSLTQSLRSISQGNLHIGQGAGSFGTIANQTDRFFFYNDEFYLDAAFNMFKISLSAIAVGNEGFDFQENTFYADDDSDVFATVEGTGYVFADFNVTSTGDSDQCGGQNNTREAFPASVQKVAAGKTWTWNGTILSGVDL